MEYLFGVGIVFVSFILYLLLRKKNKEELIQTEEFKEIIEILNKTNKSVFITGKAGTGKSSLLKHFIKNTNKKHVVLAPTGIAALNVGGQTIHSFFKFPPAIITADKIKPNYVKAELFKNLQMIIIDEISMVRADLMQGIDMALRKNRNNDEPFGGIQMVFIGDLFQLPPVLPENDRKTIIETYGGQYFFDATVFKNFQYEFKELTKIFRQSANQTEFKNMLNNIRNNTAKFGDMVLLNSRHKENVGNQEDSIYLTTRKTIARNINISKLENITGEEFTFLGKLSGKYSQIEEAEEEKLEDKLPAPYRLKLKKNAQVMMLKNDPSKRWVNGSIGKVSKLEEDKIFITISGETYNIERESWKEVDYVLNKETKNIEEVTVVEFRQFPIQLSYAMTIHKSQGKTFDKITVDVGAGAFAHGQIYVALSRCKTLEGIVLNNPIKDSDIIVDTRVVEFYRNRKVPVQNVTIAAKPQLVQKPVNNLIMSVLNTAINNNNRVRMSYENYNGETSERELSNIKMSNEFKQNGYEDDHIKAYCHLRKEDRTFRIDRIANIEIIE